MNCYSCSFFSMNDYVHGYGTCEPQEADFKIDHRCNLPEGEIKEIEALLGHMQNRPADKAVYNSRSPYSKPGELKEHTKR